MQRVEGDGFNCVIQHNWEDLAKVDAPFEHEDVVLLWSHEKLDGLKINKKDIEQEWRDSLARTKKGGTTQWRP
eukprot:1067230-Karenia_brevis.AAC.1